MQRLVRGGAFRESRNRAATDELVQKGLNAVMSSKERITAKVGVAAKNNFFQKSNFHVF